MSYLVKKNISENFKEDVYETIKKFNNLKDALEYAASFEQTEIDEEIEGPCHFEYIVDEIVDCTNYLLDRFYILDEYRFTGSNTYTRESFIENVEREEFE